MRTLTSLLLIAAFAASPIYAQVYPGNIATDGDLLVARNLIQTGLAQTIDASQTVIQVTSPSNIVANMTLTIEKEIVKVLGVNGNNITVSRAFDGSTAAQHVIGSLVSGYIVAAHHNALKDEIKAIEAALGPNLANIAQKSDFVGTIDANTGLCDFTTLSGLPDGPLPAAATANNGFYVVATVAGEIPGGPLAGVTMNVGDWAISDGTTWTKLPVGPIAPDWLTLPNKPYYDVREYQFSRTNGLGAAGDLTSAGINKVITLTPCPKGATTTPLDWYVYITGGTGTAEAVPVTASTCSAGGATGTITVTTANSHTGAWQVQSASAGILEILQSTTGSNLAILIPSDQTVQAPSIRIRGNSVSIFGYGFAKPAITFTSTSSSDMFVFNPSAGSASWNEISNLYLKFQGAKTSGIGISAVNQVQFRASRILMEFSPIGYSLTGTTNLFHLSDLDIRETEPTTGVSILIDADAFASRIDRVIAANNAGAEPAAGLRIKRCGDIIVNDSHFIDSGNAFELSPGTGQTIASFECNSCYGDNSSGSGFALTPVSGQNGNIVRVRLNSPWGGQNNHGFVIQNNGTGVIDGVAIVNAQAYINQNTGILLDASSGIVRNVSIVNANVSSNSQIGSGLAAGILINDNVEKLRILGGLSGLGDGFTSNPQSYGLQFAVAVTGATVTGMNLTGNVTGPVFGIANIAGFLRGNIPADSTANNGDVETSTFATLPTGANRMFICTDCQVTSGADNTCATGGTGALAVRLNGAWRCFNNQNVP